MLESAYGNSANFDFKVTTSVEASDDVIVFTPLNTGGGAALSKSHIKTASSAVTGVTPSEYLIPDFILIVHVRPSAETV